MKIVFVTGSHPRHAYIARALASTGHLVGLVVEKREKHIPSPPEGISAKHKEMFNLHFSNRASTEENFFGEGIFPDVTRLNVTHQSLNGSETSKFLQNEKPDLLLSYGCHMLSNEVLLKVDGHRWNIHGGLSPWYRGGVTHFWPSYMLEPQMTGMTIHQLTQQLDAGDVIHQCTADLIPGDGIHQLAARAVVKIAEELPKLLSIMEKGELKAPIAHKTSGKLWLGNEWKPEHLAVIYQLHQDQIVDKYLAGELTQSTPNIVRQFDV